MGGLRIEIQSNPLVLGDLGDNTRILIATVLSLIQQCFLSLTQQAKIRDIPLPMLARLVPTENTNNELLFRVVLPQGYRTLLHYQS